MQQGQPAPKWWRIGNPDPHSRRNRDTHTELDTYTDGNANTCANRFPNAHAEPR